MKRLIANTKFQSPKGLIYIGPVSDYDSAAFGYGHQIDSYSDEFKEAVIEIVNNMKKERNKKGVDLTHYTNDADKIIQDLTSVYNHTYFPIDLLKQADIFDGEYYIDYTDLYRLIDQYTGQISSVKNYAKLIKSSPYYISEDSDGQFNLVPNQTLLDLLDTISPNGLLIDMEYDNRNIVYRNQRDQIFYTFYPVDKSSAMTMKKVIDNLVWQQDITDYILSQEEILWRA